MSYFRKSELENSANIYRELILAPEHREIVENISKIIIKYIDIDFIALNGFIWKSIQAWQINNNMAAEKIAWMPPEKRIEEVSLILKELEILLKSVLINIYDEKHIIRALREAFHFYKNRYAYREK